MKIKIVTKVNASLEKVKTGFTEDLFTALSPIFPPVSVTRFDGCEKGDIVALELNFILFKQHWISKITEEISSTDQWHFVDEGVQLPFFLKRWTHKHVVVSNKNASEIIDDIRFSTGSLFTDLLMFPLLYLQFMYRKPIYKKIFNS